jgi:hypothetical protein
MLGMFNEIEYVDQVHVEFVELSTHLLLLLTLAGCVLLHLTYQAVLYQLLALVLCALCECYTGLAFVARVKLVFVFLVYDLPWFHYHLA